MSCDAPGCSNKSAHRSPKQLQLEEKIGRITFFKYPYHYPALFQKWKDFVNIKDWMPTYDSRICSQHFEEKWFDKTQNLKFKRLKPYAYPSIPTRFIEQDVKTLFCHVPGCESSESKIKFRLVRFPQAKDRKEFSRWVENIMNFAGATSELIQTINSESRVCVDHFEPECFRVLNNKQILRYGSVPTLNLLGTPVHRNLFNDAPKVPVIEKDEIDIPKCAVSFCGSKFFESKDLAFHPFPMDWAQNILWIQAAKPYNNDQKFEYLCSKHFKEECFESQLTRILKKGAVPSVFPNKKLNIQDIEEMLLPHLSRSDSMPDPLSSERTILSPSIPVISKTTPKNAPVLNPLKRLSTTNITSDIPPKLIMLSKTTLESPKKKLIIIKKSISGNNEISLMSPDQKITFLPKNSIQILTPKNLDYNKLIHSSKNCSMVQKGPAIQCACGVEVKVHTSKEKTRKKIEQKIILDKKKEMPIKEDVPALFMKEDKILQSLEKKIEQKILPEKNVSDNVIVPEVESTILKNTLESSNKDSKATKSKQKYIFLQCNDVKAKRKTSKKNTETTNIHGSSVENNLDTNTQILSNLDSKILDKIKKINGKIVKILPVVKTNLELSEKSTVKNADPIIKLKNFETPSKKIAQNLEPAQNPLNKPPDVSEAVLEKSAPSKQHKKELGSKKSSQKDNFVSCTVVDLTESAESQDTNDSTDQSDDVIPIIPKDPLALSDDENNSEVESSKSLLVPMKTVQRLRNRKPPRKVLIKYVDQKRSMASTPLTKITRKSKNNIDPFLLKRKNLRDKFDQKITQMIPKVILKDIFHGKSPLNSNIRITVRTRTLPKLYQKPHDLTQNEPIDLDNFVEKKSPKKKIGPKCMLEKIAASKKNSSEVLVLSDSESSDRAKSQKAPEDGPKKVSLSSIVTRKGLKVDYQKLLRGPLDVKSRGTKKNNSKIDVSNDSKTRTIKTRSKNNKLPIAEILKLNENNPKKIDISSSDKPKEGKVGPLCSKLKATSFKLVKIPQLEDVENKLIQEKQAAQNVKKVASKVENKSVDTNLEKIFDSTQNKSNTGKDLEAGFIEKIIEPVNDIESQLSEFLVTKTHEESNEKLIETDIFKEQVLEKDTILENETSQSKEENIDSSSEKKLEAQIPVVDNSVLNKSTEITENDVEKLVEEFLPEEKETKERSQNQVKIQDKNCELSIEMQLHIMEGGNVTNDSEEYARMMEFTNMNEAEKLYEKSSETSNVDNCTKLDMPALDTFIDTPGNEVHAEVSTNEVSEVRKPENEPQVDSSEVRNEVVSPQVEVSQSVGNISSFGVEPEVDTFEVATQDLSGSVAGISCFEVEPKDGTIEVVPEVATQNLPETAAGITSFEAEVDAFEVVSEVQLEVANQLQPEVVLHTDVTEQLESCVSDTAVSQYEVSPLLQHEVETRLQFDASSKHEVELEQNEVVPQLKTEVAPQLQVEVLPQLQNKVVPGLQSEIVPQLLNEDQLQDEVAYQLQRDITPQIQGEVAYKLQNEVSHQLQTEVSQQLQNEVSAQLQKEVSQLQNENSTQLKNEVTPQLQNEVSTQLQNEVLSRLQNEVPRQLQNDVSQNQNEASQLQTDVTSQLQTEIVSLIQTEVATQIQTEVLPQLQSEGETSGITKRQLQSEVAPELQLNIPKLTSEVESEVISEQITPNISDVCIDEMYLPEATNEVVTSEVSVSEADINEVDSKNEVITQNVDTITNIKLEFGEIACNINIETIDLKSIGSTNILPNLNNFSDEVMLYSGNTHLVSEESKIESEIQNSTTSTTNLGDNDCGIHNMDTTTQTNTTPDKIDCTKVESPINDSLIVENLNKTSDSTYTSIAVQVDAEISKTDAKKRKIHATYKIKQLGKKLKQKNAYIKKLTARNKMLEYRYKMAECKTRLLIKEHKDLYSLLEDFDPENKILKKIRKIK